MKKKKEIPEFKPQPVVYTIEDDAKIFTCKGCNTRKKFPKRMALFKTVLYPVVKSFYNGAEKDDRGIFQPVKKEYTTFSYEDKIREDEVFLGRYKKIKYK